MRLLQPMRSSAFVVCGQAMRAIERRLRRVAGSLALRPTAQDRRLMEIVNELRERQRRRREASGLPEPLPLLASYEGRCLSVAETLRAKMDQRRQLRLADQDKTV